MDSLQNNAFSQNFDVVVSCMASRTGGKVSQLLCRLGLCQMSFHLIPSAPAGMCNSNSASRKQRPATC